MSDFFNPQTTPFEHQNNVDVLALLQHPEVQKVTEVGPLGIESKVRQGADGSCTVLSVVPNNILNSFNGHKFAEDFSLLMYYALGNYNLQLVVPISTQSEGVVSELSVLQSFNGLKDRFGKRIVIPNVPCELVEEIKLNYQNIVLKIEGYLLAMGADDDLEVLSYFDFNDQTEELTLDFPVIVFRDSEVAAKIKRKYWESTSERQKVRFRTRSDKLVLFLQQLLVEQPDTIYPILEAPIDVYKVPVFFQIFHPKVKEKILTEYGTELDPTFLLEKRGSPYILTVEAFGVSRALELAVNQADLVMRYIDGRTSLLPFKDYKHYKGLDSLFPTAKNPTQKLEKLILQLEKNFRNAGLDIRPSEKLHEAGMAWYRLPLPLLNNFEVKKEKRGRKSKSWKNLTI